MKKHISLILAIVILVSIFAGCGGSNKDNVKGQIADKELELGDIAGGTVYSNDFAGFSFTLPEGWTFASEEQLVSMMDMGTDIVAGDNKDAILEYAKKAVVYDMMAYSPDGAQNIILLFENVSLSIAGILSTPDTYLDAAVKGLEVTAAQGITYVAGDRSDIKLAGKDYRCLSTSVVEYPIFQDYLVRREGKYMVCLIVTGLEENPSAAFMQYFA